MALPSVTSANYPTAKELRDQCLADIRYSYARVGIDANVLPGSDHYRRADIFARRAAIIIANNRLSLASLSPLTATGDDLTKLASVYGVEKRPAEGASGFVKLYGTAGANVSIPTGFAATSPSGLKYEVVLGDTVTLAGQDDTAGTAPTIQIQAVSTGSDTDVDAGTTLSWDSASIGALRSTCIVDVGGLDGGANADNDETLRTRLLRKLQFPGVGGNTSQVAEWAEEASAAIEQAFVYAAVRGPGSYDVAVTEAGGDRTLNSTVTALAEANINAEMPGHADLNVTSVTAVYVDIIINASLPLPTNAGGSGGGWLDAEPWPSTADSAYARISLFPGANQIRVDSTSADPPVVGKTFALWNYASSTMVDFEILAVSGSSGVYNITLTSRPAWVEVGMYCSAAAESLNTYATEFLAQMNRLGPGEKTDYAPLLPRARRFPAEDAVWPMSLSTKLLGNVAAEHSEISNLEYAQRRLTGSTTAVVSPALPATTADPPNILVLKHLSFRKAS